MLNKPHEISLAGCAEGIDAWDIRTVAGEVTTDKFLPRLTEEERNIREEF